MSASDDALNAIYKVGYSLPGIAQVNRDLNIIKRLLVLPCSNPVGVYVELLAEAAITFAWTIIEPDPKELYHHATGKSLVCDIKSAVTQAASGTSETTKAVARTFGTLLKVYDLAVWRLFLLGALSQGLYTFSSQIFRMQGCNNKVDPDYGSLGEYVGAIVADGGWYGLEFSVNEATSKFYPVAGSGITALPNRTALLACSAQFSQFGGQPVGTGSRIIREDTGAFVDIDYNFSYSDSGAMEDPTRSNHIWYKSKSQFAQETKLSAQWSYTGDPVPLNEVFPIHSTMTGAMYS